MRDWDLPISQLNPITLANDVRFGSTDYTNDQIWELTTTGGEPPGLSLRTTFGLRAGKFRLFPQFSDGNQIISNPDQFDTPPVVHRIYPNLVLVSYAPFPSIDVISEYWIPSSQEACGRLKISNNGVIPRTIRLEWIALLSPNQGGARMMPFEAQGVRVLKGITEDLEPVVFMTGGVEVSQSPLPALIEEIKLLPGTSHEIIWAQSACSQGIESFNRARQRATSNFDAERANIELRNASRITISTGIPDWDKTLAMTQQIAFQLLIGPNPFLPNPSLVITRKPDQGFSFRGDGSDYNYLWSGQTPIQASFLMDIILPSVPELAKGLLLNFLAVQDETNGFIDLKPGLGGQRSRLLATPILADLAWRIYEYTEDKLFLADTYSHLLNFLFCWFSPERDRDGDGIPECDHISQLGIEDHPIFSLNEKREHHVDIKFVESPAMCAYLYRECQALLQIGSLIDQNTAKAALQAHADNLLAAVGSSWNPEKASYLYWDRDLHLSSESQLLGEITGPGILYINSTFERPVRLGINILAGGERTRNQKLTVHGKNHHGDGISEEIPKHKWQWFYPHAGVTTENTFLHVESIEISELFPEDYLNCAVVDHQFEDLGLLLPLWAGMSDDAQTQSIIQNTLTNPDRYWQPYGLSACPISNSTGNPDTCHTINLPINMLLARSLLRHGYRSKSAELFTHLMALFTKSLQENSGFRRHYNAITGQGDGERNPLDGLPPLGLFLDILGVRMISPWRVRIEGTNPFPWPITVKDRGLTVLRTYDRTEVTFPDGETIGLAIQDREAYFVTSTRGEVTAIRLENH